MVIIVLKLFEASGFKNFKDTVTLNFSGVRDFKFNSQCITDHLIGKAIIYGKNSIGKTNFGLALFDLVSHLSSKNVAPGLYDYYLNVANINDYAEFHYVFAFGADNIGIMNCYVMVTGSCGFVTDTSLTAFNRPDGSFWRA